MTKTMDEIVVFWFRRDLRLQDNVGLSHALESGYPVLPLFIFDDEILEELPEDDARVSFIYNCLQEIDEMLKSANSSLLVRKGKVTDVWKSLLLDFNINAVYTNKDYEPYAIARDQALKKLLQDSSVSLHSYKDQVIFEEQEVVKDDGNPYTVYTPFKNKWLSKLKEKGPIDPYKSNLSNLLKEAYTFPSLDAIGFKKSAIQVKPYDLSDLHNYENIRNDPGLDETSYLSPHLRFGTIGIRELINKLGQGTEVFLSELIWREFFMQILFHFPKVVDSNFRSKYDGIVWRNNEQEFEKWCLGETGYPLVDAGMRQLNKTGYMHNRVRMVTASFLCKHLLIDWKWGEAYFAKKLLDYELSSNNGNWQWSAGTGCDAAPYFRIFNPTSQLKKFDTKLVYTRRWVDDFDSLTYAKPIVDHTIARKRALATYKEGISES